MQGKEWDGRRVAQIWFNDTYATPIQERQGMTLMAEEEYLGDHSERWIKELHNGQEVARHNVRGIVSIKWLEPIMSNAVLSGNGEREKRHE